MLHHKNEKKKPWYQCNSIFAELLIAYCHLHMKSNAPQMQLSKRKLFLHTMYVSCWNFLILRHLHLNDPRLASSLLFFKGEDMDGKVQNIVTSCCHQKMGEILTPTHSPSFLALGTEIRLTLCSEQRAWTSLE